MPESRSEIFGPAFILYKTEVAILKIFKVKNAEASFFDEILRDFGHFFAESAIFTIN
jgi:hypothetical protein